MAKLKTTFICQSCGYQSANWLGKCPSCSSWNSFQEEIIQDIKSKQTGTNDASKPKALAEINANEVDRIKLLDSELNRTLGGGIVPGAITLIGGEPGIGKSTLLLQLALSLENKKVLYVSGEESEYQIKLRAERFEKYLSDCFIHSSTNLEIIIEEIKNIHPAIVIIDSIQTIVSQQVESTIGSVSQIRYCASQLIEIGKSLQIPIFIIGHINKEGLLAGPKVLEHMVDSVLQFEGERNTNYRILRTLKNRFGSTSELGIYEMTSSGLVGIQSPSKILISRRDEDLSGVAVGVSLQGNRPLLVEVQSLVSRTAYGTPQRNATGFDQKRLSMLIAVLEKRLKLKLGFSDIFLNITGGIRVDDPSLDLAVCASLLSSFQEKSISKNKCFIGEVGLGGEIRPSTRVSKRISEAKNMGFSEVFISKHSDLSENKNNRTTIKLSKLNDLVNLYSIDKISSDIKSNN